MEAMVIMVTFGVAFAIIMVVIHFFSSCSTNIVYNEGLFDEPSAVGKVQLSDDDDDDDDDSYSKNCISWNSDGSDMSSSHWGAESSPGIERVLAASRQWRELGYCVTFDPRFEAMNQSRSLPLDVKLADLLLRWRLGTSSMSALLNYIIMIQVVHSCWASWH